MEGIPHHQSIPTGLQSAQTDAEEHGCGEGVVVYETSALDVSMSTIQGQVNISVSGVKHRAEVNLKRDGLNATVYTDISVALRNNIQKGNENLQMEIA